MPSTMPPQTAGYTLVFTEPPALPPSAQNVAASVQTASARTLQRLQAIDETALPALATAIEAGTISSAADKVCKFRSCIFAVRAIYY